MLLKTLLLQKYTEKSLDFKWTSGTEFEEDLSGYKLIIHCGGCMLNEREMKYRLKCAVDQNTPMTNYGTAIAYMNGILKSWHKKGLHAPEEIRDKDGQGARTRAGKTEAPRNLDELLENLKGI